MAENKLAGRGIPVASANRDNSWRPVPGGMEIPCPLAIRLVNADPESHKHTTPPSRPASIRSPRRILRREVALLVWRGATAECLQKVHGTLLASIRGERS